MKLLNYSKFPNNSVFVGNGGIAKMPKIAKIKQIPELLYLSEPPKILELA